MYGYSLGLYIYVGAGAADGGCSNGQGHRQLALCLKEPACTCACDGILSAH